MFHLCSFSLSSYSPLANRGFPKDLADKGGNFANDHRKKWRANFYRRHAIFYKNTNY